MMRLAIAFAFLVSATASSWAASVTNLQGQVLVNTGNGFRAVQGVAQAGAGARVVANQNGQGVVQYDDGCTVTVNPGQVYIIAAVSPCSTGQQPPPGTNGFAIGAAVVGATVGGIILYNGLTSASP